MKPLDNQLTLKFLFNAWFFSLILPLLLISDYDSYKEFSGNDFFAKLKFFFISVFIIYVLFFLNTKENKFRIDINAHLIFIFFIFICILSSIWSINPFRTFVNSVLLFAFFLCFLKIKNIIKYEELFAFLPLIILTTLITAISVHGISGRFIGGNLPNDIGNFCFFGIFFSFFLKRKYLVFFFNIFFIGIILLINSRIYLLCSSLFYFTYFFLNKNIKKKNYIIILTIYFFGSLFLILNSYFQYIYQELLDFFKVFDENRGINSKFTGRIDYWILGIELFKEKMFLGYGFRTRTGIDNDDIYLISSHSGFLNLIIDVGILGFTFFLITMIKSIKNKISFSNIGYNSLILSVIPSAILMLTFEPAHFFLGLPITLLLILIIIDLRLN